jgi:hypothetical protein
MYSVLIALTLESLLNRLAQLKIHIGVRQLTNMLAPALVAALVLLPGFPLVTGVIVADKRPLLPPMHVKLPAYWNEMTAFIDATPQAGSLLVLPPDDNYQMPYRWGYFGNDQFVADLMTRPVLNPTTGYFSASDQLSSAVNLTAKSILALDWPLTDRLLRVLGTPLVLVRTDLDPLVSGRAFLSPDQLLNSLQQAPIFDQIHIAGPLRLFSLRGFGASDLEQNGFYAMTDSTNPDLRILPQLPPGSALVYGPPEDGTPFVQQVPDVRNWAETANKLTWTFDERSGWTYDLVSLGSDRSRLPIDSLTSGAASP